MSAAILDKEYPSKVLYRAGSIMMTPEEWYEEELPEGTERIKRKRVKYPKDIDFNTLVVINPKTGKPYPVYKLRALYREGKLELPE